MIRGAPIRSACHLAIGLIIAALLLHTWFVMGLIVPVVISGSSMAPTLGSADGDRGERVLVDRTAFLFRAPRRWDIVVFRCPYSADQLCVKRIVGLPGETVTLERGKVLINGETVDNTASDRGVDGQQPIYYGVRHGDRPQRVDGRDVADIPWPDPNGPGLAATWLLGSAEYFVIGDNASVSDDSRNWVPKSGLDAKLLLGKPLGVR